MRGRRIVKALVAVPLFACAGPSMVTSVIGSVRGVSFRHPIAISDRGPREGTPNVVLITDDAHACEHLSSTGPFTPSAVSSGRAREAALILKPNAAWLDLGNHDFPLSGTGPEERLTASESTFRPRDGDPTQGSFSATFDGERLEGEYAAAKCDGLNAGCASSGGGLMPWLAAAWWAARRRGTALLTTSSH